MPSIPWNCSSRFNGQTRSLHHSLLAWRRAARTGRGALGTVTTSKPVRLASWADDRQELGVAECLALLQEMPLQVDPVLARR